MLHLFFRPLRPGRRVVSLFPIIYLLKFSKAEPLEAEADTPMEVDNAATSVGVSMDTVKVS